jgi:CO/xanthine dehydrogenase Mo-binding subunit
MLHAATLRSPHPRAAIRSRDGSRAAAMPGVRAVLFGGDIPGENRVPVIHDDMPLLAGDEVRYVGEPVALVAADDETTARRSLAAVRVDYEPLQPLLDFRISTASTAPNLFGADNVFARHVLERGDAAAGKQKSAWMVSRTFETPCQEHAYIETQGMLAVPLPNGGVDVTGSLQCPFYVQAALATALGLPLAKVRVRQATTGGAFGGKEDVPSIVAGHAALLALAAGRPVRLVYRRDEDIVSMSKRHRSQVRLAMGCDAKGRLTFIEGEVLLDGGAYATLSPVVLWRSVIHAAGAYTCPNVSVTGRVVATNTVPAGAFRGFGSPQSLFAIESLMDELAAAAGIDPAEMRRINILREGERTSAGQVVDHSCGLEETLEKALASSGWTEKKKAFRSEQGPVRQGIGLSTIFYGVGLGAGGKHMARAGTFLQIAADASVQIAVGTTELGQGMRTVLAQITAEALGLPYENVAWLDTDTSRVPDSGPTVASRSTTLSGNALLDACSQAKRAIVQAAAGLIGRDPGELEIRDGAVRPARGGGNGITVVEAIAECNRRNAPMTFQGFSVAPETSWDAEKGCGSPYFVYAYATNVAHVAVHTRTGAIDVIKVWAAHDVGRAVNPRAVEGQIEGGVLQGLGFALSEEFALRDGRPLQTDLATYVIPCAPDAPAVEAVIVESPFRGGPFGAKGFGEQPLMGIAPAVLNAVRDAVGIRIDTLPTTPEKVWEKLRKNAGEPGEDEGGRRT